MNLATLSIVGLLLKICPLAHSVSSTGLSLYSTTAAIYPCPYPKKSCNVEQFGRQKKVPDYHSITMVVQSKLVANHVSFPYNKGIAIGRVPGKTPWYPAVLVA